MTQVVSRWPVTAKGRVRSQASLCGIVVYKVELGQV
jgi:hypothetical protein